MHTNHRRQNKGKFLVGFDYSYLTAISLIKHGCSPNYCGRDGANAAKRGFKKKLNRENRHRENQNLRKALNEHLVNN